MSASAADAERRARAFLSFLADPGDELLGALLSESTALEVLRVISGGVPDREALRSLVMRSEDQDDRGADDSQDSGPAQEPLPVCRGAVLRTAGGSIPGLASALKRWRARLGLLPTVGQLASWQRDGIRLVCPGDPEWPTQLDDLGRKRPIVLWLRGNADLRRSCLRALSVVGARAATAYGSHVAMELAATLAEHGFAIVSGGAYGIDGCAHRGALAAGGVTVTVLANGLNYCYPRGHAELFREIVGQGVLVSECPPVQPPTRPGFLVRNRVIAALSSGTVVVEAAPRSGALNTAAHASRLNRLLMAVPGPVTSDMSAGCHQLIRDGGAVCVTCAREVMELADPLTSDTAETTGSLLGPAVPRDLLDPTASAVLEAIPARGGRGPASIAVVAGVDIDTAIGCLGLLAAAGFIERCGSGWRLFRATGTRSDLGRQATGSTEAR